MYFNHIRIIAKHVIDKMDSLSQETSKHTDEDNVYDDIYLCSDTISYEAKYYANSLGWCVDELLTLRAARCIASQSLHIQDSVYGMYSGDNFEEIAWGALLGDVRDEVKKLYPNWESADPCERN
jgi:hypothetical protein